MYSTFYSCPFLPSSMPGEGGRVTAQDIRNVPAKWPRRRLPSVVNPERTRHCKIRQCGRDGRRAGLDGFWKHGAASGFLPQGETRKRTIGYARGAQCRARPRANHGAPARSHSLSHACSHPLIRSHALDTLDTPHLQPPRPLLPAPSSSRTLLPPEPSTAVRPTSLQWLPRIPLRAPSTTNSPSKTPFQPITAPAPQTNPENKLKPEQPQHHDHGLPPTSLQSADPHR